MYVNERKRFELCLPYKRRTAFTRKPRISCHTNLGQLAFGVMFEASVTMCSYMDSWLVNDDGKFGKPCCSYMSGRELTLLLPFVTFRLYWCKERIRIKEED